MTSTEKLISQRVQQLRHRNFQWLLVLTLVTLLQSLVSQLFFIPKCSKLEKELKMTSVEKLISQRVQQLGHPKFVWHFDLNLATCSQSLKFEQVTVWKCLKLEKQSNLTFIISITTRARASKFCVVLCLKLRRTPLRFGVWATHNSEMLKVREVVNMTLING